MPRPANKRGGADEWNDDTEDLHGGIPDVERWPGDHRPIVRVTPVLKFDVLPVSHADYARFVLATGHRPPWRADAPPTALLDAPVVGVDIEDARAFARWAGKRLPVETEWVAGTGFLGATRAAVGAVWEWTASRYSHGHVVRGGPFRDRPGTRGQVGHRSWEDSACPDVGFRCVIDG
jgi:formylglycine-generating enzyme required for sulfatase activity